MFQSHDVFVALATLSLDITRTLLSWLISQLTTLHSVASLDDFPLLSKLCLQVLWTHDKCMAVDVYIQKVVAISGTSIFT